MKKFLKRILLSLTLMFMALSNPVDTLALTPSDLIVPQQTENEEEIIALHDTSWSMRTTFKWEDKIIREKTHNNFVFDRALDFCSDGYQSNIFETLNLYAENYDNILLASDLWDTCSEDLETADGKTLIIMVPYYSNYNDGVKHVEDIVMNIILESWTNSTVYVVYLDDEIISYSNLDTVTESPFNKLIPDEEVAKNIATSITEEVDIDESIPRDSIVVLTFQDLCLSSWKCYMNSYKK